MFLLYVCNGQEGGWFGGVATVDEVRRPHKVVALTVYWALPPSLRTVQGSHSPHCLTALSLSPNPRPFARSQPLTLLPLIYRHHSIFCENGAEVTSQPEVSIGSEAPKEPENPTLPVVTSLPPHSNSL